MEAHYSTLRILYLLVKDSPNPTQFACLPAEIITRHDQPWDEILSHLDRLATDELILYITPAVITITQKGIALVETINHSSATAPFLIEKVA